MKNCLRVLGFKQQKPSLAYLSKTKNLLKDICDSEFLGSLKNQAEKRQVQALLDSSQTKGKNTPQKLSSKDTTRPQSSQTLLAIAATISNNSSPSSQILLAPKLFENI